LSASHAQTSNAALTLSGGSSLQISASTFISGNVQILAGYYISSSNFIGPLTGTSSWANNSISSSYALTASYSANASAADFNTLLNKPTLVSSSVQVNTGSFTGSFTGSLQGSITSASYALTASYAANASAADFNTLLNKPTLVSNSLQINTGSFTGSFTGSLQGSITSASYALTSSYSLTASYAQTASIAQELDGPGDLILSGNLFVSGNIQASPGYYISSSNFIGPLTGTSSWANNSISSSYALTASYSANASAADFNTLLNKPTLVSSSAQINTGSFTGSFTGSLQGTITSASYALTASYAANISAADFNTLLNKPTLVSSSAQINTGSFTGSFVGTLTGNASTATSASHALNANSASMASVLSGASPLQISASTFISGNVQILAGYYISSSAFSGTFSGNGSSILGIISSSYSITSSYGSLAQNSISSSYALTSSYADNVSIPTSVSFAQTASAATSLTFYPTIGRKIRVPYSFIAENGTTVLLTNMGTAENEFSSNTRIKINLSGVASASISARVTVAGSSTATLKVQYSTDESTWFYLGGTSVLGPAVSLASIGTILGSEIPITGAAKQEVVLRLISSGGDGGADPRFGNVTLFNIYDL
jgi:aryl carrier-like protein